MPIIGYDDKKNIRLLASDYKAIQRICSQNSGLYNDPSHFMRSWIRRGIRNYKEPEREKNGKQL
jgi:hypothetical protein